MLDGFMGSGTTLLAAERTQRVGYGVEIEGGYVDVTIRRWKKMTGHEAILVGTDETFAQVRARRAAADEALATGTTQSVPGTSASMVAPASIRHRTRALTA